MIKLRELAVRWAVKLALRVLKDRLCTVCKHSAHTGQLPPLTTYTSRGVCRDV